jgi:hypothetical protein
MSNLERVPARSVVARPTTGSTISERLQASRTGRALATIEHQTIVRTASVQSEGFVEAEKLREVDRLAHTAMNGQAFLRGWANHLAGDDPMVADELRFFSDIAKLGKGEIIASAIDCFRCK